MINIKLKNIQNGLIACSLLASIVPNLNLKAEDTKKLEELVNKVDSRLEEVEIQAALNKLKFSGVLINRYEAFHTTYGVPGADKSKDQVNAFSTYFALNFDVKVTPKINIYSTLAMSKFWNNDGRNEGRGYYTISEAGSYALKGSTPMIDRAYLTYNFDIPMVFAIGRMSTSNGLPINQLDGLERLGTYPRFAYNAIFDGLALVYNFNSLLPAGNELTMRAFYTPFANISDTDRTRQLQDSGTKLPSNTWQGGLLTEYGLTNLSWLNKLNLTYMYYNFSEFYNDGQNSHDTSTNSSPNNYSSHGGAHMGFIGLEDIAHIGLNASASGLFYSQKASAMPDKSQADPKKYNSKAYLYNLNQKISSNLVVGAEYITTDENFYLDEWAYQNIIPFYGTPNSKGYHVFVTNKLAQAITLRVGAYKLNSKACKEGSANFGLYDNDSKSTSVYANLRLDF